jgi:protein phosphatase
VATLHSVSYGLSDVGRRRPHNEDAYLSDDVLGLYVVADGVGGNAKGELASQESVEQIHGWIKARRAEISQLLETPNEESVGQVHRLVESAIQQACYMVFGMASLDPNRRGMSTTISALMTNGDSAFIGQVGDSRVYQMRGNEVLQRTEDHTLINYKLKHGLLTPEEARKAPGKNIITRAVGHRDYVQVDTFHVRVKEGDRFLLCSDGLHGYLGEKEIAPILGQGQLSAAAREFVRLANARGGSDNITVIVVSVEA